MSLFMVLSEGTLLFDRIDDAIRKAVFDEDYEAAHRMLRPHAEQGDANAQTLLGSLFYDGCGTAQNFSEATRLFSKACDQEHPVAQYCLAGCYLLGRGVSEDNDRALELFLRSANQGCINAQFFLAELFMVTRAFGDRKPVEAYKWARIAAPQLNIGDARQSNLTHMVELLEREIESEELAEAKRLIAEWKPKRLYT